MIIRVADKDRAVGSYRSTVRSVQRCRAGVAAITRIALTAIPGDGRDNSGALVDQADRVIFGVDDQQITVTINGELLRRIKDRGESGPAVTGVAPRARPGDGRDDPASRINGAQRAALTLEDPDGAVIRDLDGPRAIDPRPTCRPAIAAVLGLSCPGECPDGSRSEVDDADAMVGNVGDKQPALFAVERQTVRLDHSRAGRRAVIAAKA